jgi:phosphoesterase RecJ-like protein
MSSKINTFIDKYEKFLLVQADNPDADSLASALALEQILAAKNKGTALYCAVDIPSYLRYLPGWDRVSTEVPKEFDAVIIVDTTAINLFEAAERAGALSWIKAKPSLVIDHHGTEPTLDFADIVHQEAAVACGELIYDLAQENKWQLSQTAKEMLAVAILSDSLGLISESTTSHSINVIAELVEKGVVLAKLDHARKAMQKKSPGIVRYKGELLKRLEYSPDQKIAIIQIPWEEIEKYSHEYNPSMLVIDEMRQVEKVTTAIAFKTYPDGRITAKIRCNYGYPIAAKLAENFGGGGHPYASGFRVIGSKDYNEVKRQAIELGSQLIEEIDNEDKPV